ncbi:biopolymer transporter ExbB [Sulfitobacter sp. KE34]|uniref:Biopolymer transporter ExbB n=1 Tax=Sulfitobacter faviae TaxID=1775881 RepID=A0AAX3LMK9_9RHOB|nr:MULTISPECIES: biopolymer transporter ExbB [Sulfitobacter]MDF3348691.1 biopolymer transporter ExbB [Sulfitobacter sp. KE12]MDF3352362.1 biopolymer transporter ExbB [Sulfitobacter sp. KE27]MDF3356009.1 biopolymer transporter ExbB [Sulfitobacter sp. KE33]MDF3360437.1 biopolymer transporter ExbB [Sulfitobacter sp. Ks41]MDF3363433.1 biopolymer transporter ExbB [Sulfitobacter sp. Ks34]
MAQPDRKAKPQFSQPVRQISLMLIALGLTGTGVFLALPRVLPIFAANPWLNGVIIFVFIVGVLACFYQVMQLIGSVRWIEDFAAGNAEPDAKPPQLLAPLASLLRQRGARMQVSTTSTRSILDSVASRIDEVREITRYIVNMLIFLGLLGTFYGLATTVPAVVDTIRSLAPGEGEAGVNVFGRLMTGLEAQLGGMGVAFGSSLLGLAGSLVVGLLELFAGHGQNRFYQELEDWLSSITRVGLTSGDDVSDQNIMASVMDQMVEQMAEMQQMFTQSDVSRAMVDDKLGKLADAVDRMTTRMEHDTTTNSALERVADGQDRLIATLEGQVAGEGIDAESRMRLRSIDVQMLRILEEISAGRQETMAELRKDISLLAKALSGQRAPEARRLRASDIPGGGDQ